MNGLLLLLRGSGAPPARLDSARFTTFFDLDFSELLAFAFLAFIMPLATWGLGLPEPAHLMTVIAFPAWALLLFFVKLEERNLAYWLGRMLPFWARQREFRARRTVWRVTPRTEAADAALLSGENALSWRWEQGGDGVPELHIYETPLRPYRALVATGGRRTPGRRMRANIR